MKKVLKGFALLTVLSMLLMSMTVGVFADDTSSGSSILVFNPTTDESSEEESSEESSEASAETSEEASSETETPVVTSAATTSNPDTGSRAVPAAIAAAVCLVAAGAVPMAIRKRKKR